MLAAMDETEFRDTQNIAGRAGISVSVARTILARFDLYQIGLAEFRLVTNPRSRAMRKYEWRRKVGALQKMEEREYRVSRILQAHPRAEG